MTAIWPSYDEYQVTADQAQRVIPLVTITRN